MVRAQSPNPPPLPFELSTELVNGIMETDIWSVGWRTQFPNAKKSKCKQGYSALFPRAKPSQLRRPGRSLLATRKILVCYSLTWPDGWAVPYEDINLDHIILQLEGDFLVKHPVFFQTKMIYNKQVSYPFHHRTATTCLLPSKRVEPLSKIYSSGRHVLWRPNSFQ